MSERLYKIGGFKFAYTVAQLCPRPLAHWLGVQTAIIGAKQRPSSCGIMKENLRHAIGGSDDNRDAAYWRGIRNFGRMLADYFITAPGRRNLLPSMFARPRGWEHIEKARAQGRGTIIVTGHIGHWELGAQWLAHCGVPLTIATLPESSSELSQWRTAARRLQGIKTLEVGPSREFSFVEMLGILRRNEALAILVDRPYEGTGLAVRQFDQITQFSMGAAMLAHHTGAAVIPAFVFARPDWTYESVAMPEVLMQKGPLRQTLPGNTQRIADVFASLIRQYPEQWFNYVPLYTRP
jgi:phosphatidylinositol dimannoside acyltransferase